MNTALPATGSWWRETVIYEILVPSFQDSNGDGWGDLPGITQRLDYLQDLGVGALWLTPIFASPMFDMGYDVSDYRQINPLFGTLDDFQQLLGQAHRRQLHVIIDFIPNHTSKEHVWFQSSVQSRNNAYRDYYLWHDPAPDGGAPNNWINRFGQSAWSFDARTGQYYFGTFAPEQPDLNWRNPQVRQEIWDILRFWLELGVDGVRVDALAHLLKDASLRDNPRNPDFKPTDNLSDQLVPLYSENHPELLEIIGQFHRVIHEYPERVLVGEVFQPAEQINSYQRAGADLLLDTSIFQVRFDAARVQVAIDRAEANLAPGAWPARASGDHDLQRLGTRLAERSLPLAAILHFTLRGTPVMYYGEELGLCNCHVPPDIMVDPSGKHSPLHSRDPVRMPMPWSAEPAAGFTWGVPWLPVSTHYQQCNVQAQLNEGDSLLNLYRRLLQLRSEQPLLRTGNYAPHAAPEGVIAFRRYDLQQCIVVAANLSQHHVQWHQDFRPVRSLFQWGSATIHDSGDIQLGPSSATVTLTRQT